MKKRSYKITACLKEGYSATGREHAVQEAEESVGDWMRERLLGGLPTVSGLLQSGTLFFPARGRRGDGMPVTASHTVIYFGELSSKEDEDRIDDEVAKTLESLALRLKTDLGQEEVFIVYEDRNWSV